MLIALLAQKTTSCLPTLHAALRRDPVTSLRSVLDTVLIVLLMALFLLAPLVVLRLDSVTPLKFVVAHALNAPLMTLNQLTLYVVKLLALVTLQSTAQVPARIVPRTFFSLPEPFAANPVALVILPKSVPELASTALLILSKILP